MIKFSGNSFDTAASDGDRKPPLVLGNKAILLSEEPDGFS